MRHQVEIAQCPPCRFRVFFNFWTSKLGEHANEWLGALVTRGSRHGFGNLNLTSYQTAAFTTSVGFGGFSGVGIRT